jgi:signal transduction histidine kinase
MDEEAGNRIVEPTIPTSTERSSTADDRRSSARRCPSPGPALKRAGADAWQGSRWVWSATLILLLVLGALASALDADVTVGRRWVDVGAALATVLVFAFLIDRDVMDTQTRQLAGVAVLIVAWMALTLLHPAFFIVLFALFAQLYMRLPLRWAYAGTVVLTLGSVLVSVAGTDGSPSAWVIFGLIGLLTVAGASLEGRWIHRIITQSAERRSLIEELEATRSELGEAERAAGQLEERQRLAGEIHDTLAQGFTSIVMLLEAVSADLPPDTGPDARRRLELASATARENLEEARRLVAGLDPAPLDDATLVGAVQRVVGSFGAESDVRTEVEIRGRADDLPPATEVAVLRAAQEALANVRRHASATHVTVGLTFDGSGVVLDVVDDGTGFDPGAAPGHGLRGIRRRVEQVGGEVSIDSQPGAGTHVRVRVP